jgi:hypothetical protein
MKTEIAFILDRSGSMESIASAAISGYNEFLKAQKATKDDQGNLIPSTFSLILFDHEYTRLCHRVDIQDAQPLTSKTYEPRGTTALLDAMGRTIDEIGVALAALPESERPSKVIIAILTDGAENASQDYSLADIHKRISEQTSKYSWEFLFLGANQDAIATAAAIGIHAHQAATFVAESGDVRASSQAVANRVSAMRRAQSNCNLMKEEVAAYSDSMTEVLQKVRKGKN